MKMNQNKNDWKLILFLLFAGAAGMVYFLASASEGDMVVVKRGGDIISTYSLTTDQEVKIEGENGGYNILKIQSGTVCLKEADCENQTCIRQGKISKTGQSIVCLPHEIVVSIIKADKDTDSKSEEADVIVS